ncbi:hypothetical protein RRG08_011200 [Elysia crispata]|uniref:Uncharacterized protein n=1 Tax=Elysia crispata TaxID=231223 RepID=A0AAE1DJD6_9GAST|nr:hypothetical protein RRG08_011200 [Elysia crispata]
MWNENPLRARCSTTYHSPSVSELGIP